MSCRGGYIGHQYGKDERCVRCTAWRPGFAPKREFTKARAECQVCERQQACDTDGTLGHHGYKRPGWGRIYDDCFGEGYQPFPATDALKLWLLQLDGIEKHLQHAARRLRADEFENLPFTYRWGPAYGRKREERVVVLRGESSRYDKATYTTIPSYEELKRRELVAIEAQLQSMPDERKRIEARIRKGEAKK